MPSIPVFSFNLHPAYDLKTNMKCTQDGPRICTPSISICKFFHKLARIMIQTRVYGNRSRGRLTAETTFPREGKGLVSLWFIKKLINDTERVHASVVSTFTFNNLTQGRLGRFLICQGVWRNWRSLHHEEIFYWDGKVNLEQLQKSFINVVWRIKGC